MALRWWPLPFNLIHNYPKDPQANYLEVFNNELISEKIKKLNSARLASLCSNLIRKESDVLHNTRGVPGVTHDAKLINGIQENLPN